MRYRRGVDVLGTVLLLAIVVPFVIYAVPGVIGAEHSFVVLSGSMEPAISAGDAVVVAETDPATIETGDVITFVRGNEDTPVTHRVIDVETSESGLAFITKGDANEGPDVSPVPAENVVGTVVLTIPFVGYVVRFVNTPLGFALLVALPVGALVATEVWSLVRDDEEQREEGDGGVGVGSVVDRAAEAVALLGIDRFLRSDREEWDGESDVDGDEWDGESDVDGENDRAPDETITTERGPDPEIEPHPGTDASVAPASTEEIGDESDESDDEITVHVADLTATVALLALLTPYTVYVAITLQTTATITIAFASGFSMLALGGLWLSAWFDGTAGRADDDVPRSPPSDAEPALARETKPTATQDAETRGDDAASTDASIDGPSISPSASRPKPRVVASIEAERNVDVERAPEPVLATANPGDAVADGRDDAPSGTVDDDGRRPAAVDDGVPPQETIDGESERTSS